MNSAVNMSGCRGVLMLFTILLYLPPVRGTELHHATVCHRNSFRHPPRCDEGSNIYVESLTYDINNTCPEDSRCDHPAVNRTLHDVIRSQCDGATECLTNTNEAFWESVICPPGNWLDVLYTCQNETMSATNTTTAQKSPPTTPTRLSTDMMPATDSTSAHMSPATQQTEPDAPTAHHATTAQMSASNDETMFPKAIWIGILVAALGVTVAITVLAVLCVRRRRKKDLGETVGESGTPRGGQTTSPHPGSSDLLNPNYEQSDAIIQGSRPDRQGTYDRPTDPYTVVRRPDSAHDGNMGENSNIPGSHSDGQVAFHRPKDPYTVVRRSDCPDDLNMRENSAYN